MRSPNRINRICDKLAELWKTQPDTRLGQLVYNLAASANGDIDPFYTEDNWIEREIDAQLAEATNGR